MARDTEKASDPTAGRYVILVVGAVGVAAVSMYGARQIRQGPTAEVTLPVAAEDADARVRSLSEVMRDAESARRALDLAAMETLEHELEQVASRTTIVPRAARAHLVAGELAATRALEATIRAALSNDPAVHRIAEAARRAADTHLAAAERSAAQLDAGHVAVVRARLRLASGEDLVLTDPVILLPTYRDPELRLLALARPLWTEDNPSPDFLRDVVAELESATPQTSLLRALAVLVRHRQGDPAAAREALAGLRDPGHEPPLLHTLGALLDGDDPMKNAVAVAGPPTAALGPTTDAEPPRGSGLQTAAPSNDSDLSPETVPADAPSATQERAPAPTPRAPEPTPSSKRSSPAKPSSGSSKPSSGNKDASKRSTKGSSSGDALEKLADQGCDLVRQGKAAEGFPVLQKAFDLAPGNTKVTLCMAEAHYRLGRTASASAMCDRVLQKSPRNKQARLLAAKLADESGNVPKALEHYRKVLEVDPDNATAKAYVDSKG